MSTDASAKLASIIEPSKRRPIQQYFTRQGLWIQSRYLEQIKKTAWPHRIAALSCHQIGAYLPRRNPVCLWYAGIVPPKQAARWGRNWDLPTSSAHINVTNPANQTVCNTVANNESVPCATQFVSNFCATSKREALVFVNWLVADDLLLALGVGKYTSNNFGGISITTTFPAVNLILEGIEP